MISDSVPREIVKVFFWKMYCKSYTLSSPAIIYGLKQNRYPGSSPKGLIFQNSNTSQKCGWRNGKGTTSSAGIPIPRRQKTGKHPWMKGDFNQAQNVPLKKQQTLLTYNSVKQKSNHLYHQNIYQIISHTHSTEVNLTLHEIHRPKESKTTWGSGNNTPIQQLRIFQWTFMWQMRFLKNTVSSNKYLTKTHFVLLGDVNWLPSET